MKTKAFLVTLFCVFGFACDTELGQTFSKRELTFISCQGNGMSPDITNELWRIFEDARQSGLPFEDAVLISIEVCSDVCQSDSDCQSKCHLCLGLMVEAIYFPDEDTSISPTSPTGLNLKMPLPGGKAWLLTTEIGGTDCASLEINESHTGNSYYSLDFDDISLTNGSVKQEIDVSIYAAASGQVAEVGIDPNHPNGYYVVLAHGAYTTKYLHLRDAPTLIQNSQVSTGQKLGVMGSTGISTGTHLHFGVFFNGAGGPNVSELGIVKMEEMRLSEYKTGCNSNGQRKAFYTSSNTP